MKKIKSTTNNAKTKLLFSLASLANVTAKIGAGSASSWSTYQPKVPKEFDRR